MSSSKLKFFLLSGVSILLIATFFAFFSLPLAAQTFRGSIQGRVEDASGARVAAATVKAVNISTGLSYTTEATTAGEYAFPDLPLGKYQVTVTRAGFENIIVSNVTVQAGVTFHLPVKLAVAKVSDKVNVEAAAISLDATTTTQTDVLDTSTVQNVPLNGRDFTQLLTVTPGYSGFGVGFMSTVNGSQASQINWQIEGSDNNDLWLNTSAVNQGGVYGIPGVLLPLDSVEEFSIITQAGAETSRNPGATVNLALKSGTNAVHGSAYYYNRNEFFAASPVFGTVNSSGVAVVNKNKLRDEQTGFSIGGPIFKNRTFYFVSFEHQGFDIGNPTVVTEPSTAYQAKALDVLNNVGQAYGTYAPVAVNPVSQRLLNNLWPSSALTGAASPDNYSNPGTENGYSNNVIVKLDHAINDANRISLRGYIAGGHQTAPTSSYLSPYFEASPMHVQNWALVLNSALSTHTQNQALFGINYFQQNFADADLNFDPTSLGLNTGVTSAALRGAPRINIGSDSSGNTLFDPIGINPLAGRRDLTWHVNDTLSHNVGKHQFRFSAEIRHSKIHEYYHTGQRGSFTFSGSEGPWGTSGADAYVLGLADFLAGYVSTSSIVQGDPTRYIYSSGVSLYAQDHFQVSKRLNLNYGLRYDYNQPLHNDNQDLSYFDPARGLQLAGQDSRYLYPARKKNFGPHFGFAYQPLRDSSWVIRGGFGLSYDTVSASSFLDDSYIYNGGPYGAQDNPIGSNQVQYLTKDSYTLPTDGSVIGWGSNTVKNLFSVSQHLKTPYLYNYNLNVEHRLGRAAVAQIGYVGSLGRHLLLLDDINQAALGSEFYAADYNTTRPYYATFPQYGVINELNSTGTSNYNSLQATVKTASWHGLTSQVAFTWAHTLDYGSFLALPQNSFDRKSEYGNSSFDGRRNLTAYFVYDVPTYGRGPKALTQGWKLTSLISFRSGLPFTVNNYIDASGTGENADRVNLIGNPYAGLSHKVEAHQPIYWINPDSFSANWGEYGTQRRNQLFGPGFSDVDLSIVKETPITARVKTQVRADIFNLFNRVNLGNPTYTGANGLVAIPGYGNYGVPISYTNGTQFGLPGIGPGEPFNVQLAVKLIF